MRRATRPLLLVGALALTAAVAAPSGAASLPTYQSYAVGFDSGEPSVGYDLERDAALFTSRTTTVRMRWDAKNRLTEHADVSDP